MFGAHARKKERLEARVTRRQKRNIERAARLLGTSVTEFVVMSAQQAAARTISEEQALKLRGQAQEAFVAAMLNPPKPNARARAAAQRYKDRFSSK